MNSTCINSLGLIVGIVGALMLCFFVPEINLVDKDKWEEKRHTTISAGDPTPEQIAAYKLRRCLYRVGVGLLVVSFFLQFISNLMAGR